MMTQRFWRATFRGMQVTVDRAPQGRFTIHLSFESGGGLSRVYLALSARHVERLLTLHAPGWRRAAATS